MFVVFSHKFPVYPLYNCNSDNCATFRISYFVMDEPVCNTNNLYKYESGAYNKVYIK